MSILWSLRAAQVPGNGVRLSPRRFRLFLPARAPYLGSLGVSGGTGDGSTQEVITPV